MRPRIDTRILGVWLQYHCNTIGIPCNMTQYDHFFLEKCLSVSWEGLQVRGKMRNSASYSSAHHHLHPTHPNKREWKFIRARKLFANKKTQGPTEQYFLLHSNINICRYLVRRQTWHFKSKYKLFPIGKSSNQFPLTCQFCNSFIVIELLKMWRNNWDFRMLYG